MQIGANEVEVALERTAILRLDLQLSDPPKYYVLFSVYQGDQEVKNRPQDLTALDREALKKSAAALVAKHTQIPEDSLHLNSISTGVLVLIRRV